MIKFYSNKDLSRKFCINLARWKRWSREFLPPDPLGGLQSGYARQYNPDEAFTVFLGGHLVGDLKFTIPETKRILQDLHVWLVDHHFYFDFSGTGRPTECSAQSVKNYRIAIISQKNKNDKDFYLSYAIKGMISDDTIDYHGLQAREQLFVEVSPGSKNITSALIGAASYRVLNISLLREKFLKALEEEQNLD